MCEPIRSLPQHDDVTTRERLLPRGHGGLLRLFRCGDFLLQACDGQEPDPAATRCCALTMRDAAISSIARVIFLVDCTLRMRRRRILS